MQYLFEHLCRQFCIEGEFHDAKRIDMGHINDTFRAMYRKDGVNQRFIFQRINHDVFRDPAGMMENIQRVTEHCRMKLREAGVDDLERRTLTLIYAVDGQPYYHDQDGNTKKHPIL